jgi:hypothetical protein
LGLKECTGEVTLSGVDQSDSRDGTAINFSENDPLRSDIMTSQHRYVFDCMTATFIQ